MDPQNFPNGLPTISGPVVTPAGTPNNPSPQPTSQSRRNKSKHNIALLIGLISGAVIVVLLVIFGVYAWQHGKVTSLTKTTQDQNSEITTLKEQISRFEASIKIAPSNTITGIYAGWKTFCDDFSNACYNYPNDWILAGTSSSGKTTESVSSAKNTASVQYENPYVKDALNQVYFITAVEDLQLKDLDLKIVGRVLGSEPDYIVVDATYVAANNITVGKSLGFIDTARFTNQGKNANVSFRGLPTRSSLSNIKTTDQAVEWFKTDDAKTVLQILQSYYYQQ